MTEARGQPGETRTRAPAELRVRVQFLGSGDAFGSGGRFQACIAVTTGHERYLLDCGASSLVAMRRFGVDPGSVTAILLTHLHGDHFGGVPFFLLDAQLYGKRTAPLIIAGPPGTEQRIGAAMDVLFPGSSGNRRAFSTEYVEWRSGESVAVGAARVTPFAVRHVPGTVPFALRVECGSRTLAYSGDTEWTESLVEVARDADLFISEALFFEKSVKNHLDFKTLETHRQELSCKRTILTHMGPEMLAHASAVPYEVAEDGKLIEL